MVRLWQNALLYNWKNVFEYLPIESQIHKYQEDYYKVIIKNYRDIVYELDMEKVEDYIYLYKNKTKLSLILRDEVF